MVNWFTLFVALLVLSGMSMTLPFQLVAGQTIGEENETEASAFSNGSDFSSVSESNTIIINATEVGEEQYSIGGPIVLEPKIIHSI